MKATSMFQQFDKWYGPGPDTEGANNSIRIYGFKARVLVARDIPTRHSMFTILRDMGSSKMDGIFSGTIKDDCKTMLFGFPERHQSLQENLGFLSRLAELKRSGNLPNLERVDVITHSTFTVNETPNGCLRLMEFPKDISDDDRHDSSPY